MSILSPGPAAPSPAGSPPAGSAPEGAQGSPQITDWRSTLPEDIRSNASLASYKDIASLAKSHIHAQSLIGADKLVIPGKDATPEQTNEFYKKLGRPDTHKDYALKLPDGMKPEGLDSARLEQWQDKIHKLGLTKAQGEALLSDYIAEEHTVTSANTKARQEALDSQERVLRQEFGQRYDEEINFVRLALKNYGDDELFKAIDDAGLGNNPALVKAFAKIGRASAGEGTPKDGRGPGAVNTPELAQAELEQMRINPDIAKIIMDNRHPRHAETLKRRADLFKLAFPQ